MDFSLAVLDLGILDTEFIRMVRTASVLIKQANNLASDADILEVARTQSYSRIGLILSAAKKKDNTPLFPLSPQGAYSSDDTGVSGSSIFDAVIAQFDPFTGIYASGIKRVAAFLTASVLIRALPLNASIKNVDVSDTMEKQALEDLDRIISLFEIKAATEAQVVETQSGSQQQSTFYISLGLDKNTILPVSFDIGDPLSPINLTGVRQIPYIQRNSSTDPIYFCWIYLTGNEGVNSTLTIPAPPVHISFRIGERFNNTINRWEPEKWDSEKITEAISDSINTLTLGEVGTGLSNSNIIASPNRGSTNLSRVLIRKGLLYPPVGDNSIPDLFESKPAVFSLLHHIDFISFASRSFSNNTTNELIVVNFYTLNSEEIFETRDTDRSNELANEIIRRKASIGINGVWFGLENSYTKLGEKGPHSLILTTEKGHASSSGKELVENEELSNTFYFRYIDPSLPIGSLGDKFRWRVSTTPSELEPVEYEFTLGDALTIGNAISSVEDLAFAFLQSMYKFTNTSITPNNVLGSLAHTDAVQIVAFRTLNTNYRAIVDILEIPKNVEIATGNPVKPKTPYKNGRRSIVVDAKPFKSATTGNGNNGNNLKQTEAELLASITASVDTVRSNKSLKLQAVYDRLNFLRTKRY